MRGSAGGFAEPASPAAGAVSASPLFSITGADDGAVTGGVVVAVTGEAVSAFVSAGAGAVTG